MRLNVYLRGIDIIDIELHAGRVNVAVFQPRDGDEPGAPPKIEATSGGQFEHAGGTSEPDTAVMGFGR